MSIEYDYGAIRYEELDIKRNEWLKNEKDELSPTNILAIESVYGDLNFKFFQILGEENDTYLFSVSKYLIWCDRRAYPSDEVFKVYINEECYVLNSIYTIGGRLIVEVNSVEDCWEENDNILEELNGEDITTKYFEVIA